MPEKMCSAATAITLQSAVVIHVNGFGVLPLVARNACALYQRK